MRRLINFDKARPDVALEDLMLCMAYCVEEAMLSAGAEPGRDYKMLDLFQVGAPFALEVFSKPSNDITFPAEGDVDRRKSALAALDDVKAMFKS